MTLPSRWLEPLPFALVRPLVPTDLPPLPKPVETELDDVPIAESGDPLVRLAPDLNSRHAYLEFNSPISPQHMWTRGEVLKRLRAAEASLPSGLKFQILDTWRSLDFQRELMRLYKEAIPDLEDGYVANPDNPRVPPPHTTGGAVDLTLAIDGHGIPMGADFDEFNPSAHFLYLEDLDESSATPDQILARDLRRLLAHSLLEQGFAPIFNEWWHFSYGDQRWAAFYQEPAALFGPVNP